MPATPGEQAMAGSERAGDSARPSKAELVAPLLFWLSLIPGIGCTTDVVRRMYLGRIISGEFLQRELAVGLLALAIAVGVRRATRASSHRYVVGLLTAAVLLSNGRQLGSSDNFPAAALPFQVIRSGTVYFDDFKCFIWPERYLVRVDGTAVSQYPLTIGLLALPVYAPAALGRLDPCQDDAFYHLAKIAGALLTSVGVALMYEVFVAVAGAVPGAVAVGIYLLGTAVLSLLGQSLFQHTGAVLGFSLAAFGIFRAGPRLAPLLVGFGASLAVASRAFDVFIAAAFVLAYLWKNWRKTPWVVLAGLIPVGAVLSYQAATFGSPFATGYGSDATDGWRANWFVGLAGELFSPARGLFVFSPVLLLGLPSFFRAQGQLGRTLRILGAGAVVHVAVMAKWWAWHGAWCNSSRMVSDTLPVFGLALAVALPSLLGSRRRIAWLAVMTVLSLLPHFVVTYSGYTAGPLRTYVYDLSEGPWDIRAYPPVAATLGKMR